MDQGKHRGLGRGLPTSRPILPLTSHGAVLPGPCTSALALPGGHQAAAPGWGDLRLALGQLLLERDQYGLSPALHTTEGVGKRWVGEADGGEGGRETSRRGQREHAPGLQPGKLQSLCGQLAFSTHDPRAR